MENIRRRIKTKFTRLREDELYRKIYSKVKEECSDDYDIKYAIFDDKKY